MDGVYTVDTGSQYSGLFEHISISRYVRQGPVKPVDLREEARLFCWFSAG